MKSLLLCLICSTTAFSADLNFDGLYLEFGAGTRAVYTAESVELKKGRFTIRRINDAIGESTEKGTTRRFGARLLLLGDAPDFADVRISFVYDGVALLMDAQSYRGFLETGKLPFCLVRIKPSDANEAGWKQLLDAHPKFKEAVHKELPVLPPN